MREPAVRADAREGLRAATSLNPPMLLYTYNTRVTFTSPPSKEHGSAYTVLLQFKDSGGPFPKRREPVRTGPNEARAARIVR